MKRIAGRFAGLLVFSLMLLITACQQQTTTPPVASVPTDEEPVCEQNADCEQGEICVRDSRGARCERPMPSQVSCASNSVQSQLTSANTFDASVSTCADDCAPDHACNAQTCICEKKLCNPPQFIRLTSQNMIQDALARYDEVTLQDLQNMTPGDREAFLKQKEDVVISSFEYYLNRNTSAERYDIPYPKDQFTLEPESPGGVPCGNAYYDTPGKAVEVDGTSLNGPTLDCGWGPPDVFEGMLVICPVSLIEWFDAYQAKP